MLKIDDNAKEKAVPDLHACFFDTGVPPVGRFRPKGHAAGYYLSDNGMGKALSGHR